MATQTTSTDRLLGFITEKDFAEAELEFPGIVGFFEHLEEKPKTFVELVWRYEQTADLAA